jgi:hypothetical protein
MSRTIAVLAKATAMLVLLGINKPKRVFEKSTFALTPNPSPKLGSGVFIRGFPPNKKTTRQRGAGTAGSGGVRATELCFYKWTRGDPPITSTKNNFSNSL